MSSEGKLGRVLKVKLIGLVVAILCCGSFVFENCVQAQKCNLKSLRVRINDDACEKDIFRLRGCGERVLEGCNATVVKKQGADSLLSVVVNCRPTEESNLREHYGEQDCRKCVSEFLNGVSGKINNSVDVTGSVDLGPDSEKCKFTLFGVTEDLSIVDSEMDSLCKVIGEDRNRKELWFYKISQYFLHEVEHILLKKGMDKVVKSAAPCAFKDSFTLVSRLGWIKFDFDSLEDVLEFLQEWDNLKSNVDMLYQYYVKEVYGENLYGEVPLRDGRILNELRINKSQNFASESKECEEFLREVPFSVFSEFFKLFSSYFSLTVTVPEILRMTDRETGAIEDKAFDFNKAAEELKARLANREVEARRFREERRRFVNNFFGMNYVRNKEEELARSYRVVNASNGDWHFESAPSEEGKDSDYCVSVCSHNVSRACSDEIEKVFSNRKDTLKQIANESGFVDAVINPEITSDKKSREFMDGLSISFYGRGAVRSEKEVKAAVIRAVESISRMLPGGMLECSVSKKGEFNINDGLCSICVGVRVRDEGFPVNKCCSVKVKYDGVGNERNAAKLVAQNMMNRNIVYHRIMGNGGGYTDACSVGDYYAFNVVSRFISGCSRGEIEHRFIPYFRDGGFENDKARFIADENMGEFVDQLEKSRKRLIRCYSKGGARLAHMVEAFRRVTVAEIRDLISRAHYDCLEIVDDKKSDHEGQVD